MNEQALAWMGRHKSFPSTPVFLALWLPCGFVAGTLTLLGPVRAWATICRTLELSPHVENGGVFMIIAALFMVSGYAARMITNVLETSTRRLRLLVIGSTLAVCGGAMAAWMNPALMSTNMGAEQHTERFVFGPYPDEERMLRLKHDGYTIVSLLHPAVVPFEPKLMGDEDKLAGSLGVPVIHVPMLPWISGNEDALTKIRGLAADPTKRYYVHCYLGHDRVRIVERMLEESGVSMASAAHRGIESGRRFARGRIERIAPGLYVAGFPTDEEFLYLLGGDVRQVVAFLDAHDSRQRALIEHERSLLRKHNVPLEVVQADPQRYDARRAAGVLSMLPAMPKPVLVHGYLAPSTGRSPWIDGFAQSFAGGRAALPQTWFTIPLTGGRASVVVTHVAFGPRPRRGDFRDLRRRGVVECLYVGRERLTIDAKLARASGLGWRKVKPDHLVAAVATGGPFYVYGSAAPLLRVAIEQRYRKPLSFTP